MRSGDGQNLYRGDVSVVSEQCTQEKIRAKYGSVDEILELRDGKRMAKPTVINTARVFRAPTSWLCVCKNDVFALSDHSLAQLQTRCASYLSTLRCRPRRLAGSDRFMDAINFSARFNAARSFNRARVRAGSVIWYGKTCEDPEKDSETFDAPMARAVSQQYANGPFLVSAERNGAESLEARAWPVSAGMTQVVITTNQP